MKFVALLRGINVGGNNKVEMSRLKQLFSALNFSDVTTYINSGNVIFSASEANTTLLSSTIEQAMVKDFGLEVKVLVVERAVIAQIVEQVPSDWQNNSTDQKCDVLFLWPDIDSPNVIDALIIKPGIDEVKYLPGAVIWRVWRKDYGKSGMSKLIGSELYKKSTVRNINTVRKLSALMQASL